MLTLSHSTSANPIFAPLEPSGIPQVHQTPSNSDGKGAEHGETDSKDGSIPLPRAVPEPARPVQQQEATQQQPQGQGQQSPSGGGWTGEIFPGFKVSDAINIGLTCSLIFLGFQQLRTYRRQAGIMETQTALSAEALDIAITQKEIARQAFVAAHRPVLIIRPNGYTVGDWQTDPLTLALRFVNVGTSKAILRRFHLECRITDPLKVAGTVIGGPDTTLEDMIAAGDTYDLSHSFQGSWVSERFRMSRDIHKTEVTGYVTYKSEAGRTHEVGFAWRYENDGQLGRFHLMDDPTKNYSY